MGKTGFAGNRNETKLTALQGNFVFVLGGSLFGGEKRQRLSAPLYAASAAMTPLLARRIVTRKGGGLSWSERGQRRKAMHPPPFRLGPAAR
jgi:hypothetical protein